MKPIVYFLVDASGSMEHQMPIVTDHINKIIFDRNRADSNFDIIVQAFDSNLRGESPKNTEVYLRATGGTYLWKSANTVLKNLNIKYRGKTKVLMIVITDGADTEHSHTSIEDLKNEIKVAEDILQWDLLFIGTNQNANANGQRVGFKSGKTLSFHNSDKGFEHMLQACERIVGEWATGQIAHNDNFFTEEEIARQSRLGTR